MKIIVSHDVDHLYASDHITRDLIFPKLWIRSFLHCCQGRISIKTLGYRLISVFGKRLNRIPEIMEFDRNHGVASTFFFGMANGLGMSYKQTAARPWIDTILQGGMDAGVHGIAYQDGKEIAKEKADFQRLSGLETFGIRTHYVRYDANTFQKFAQCGYLFDTSAFNKKEIELEAPYRIHDLWEFPLHIMDGYIMFDNLEAACEKTRQALAQAEQKGLPYFTFLFHDYMFNPKTYPHDKQYYEWFIHYCQEKGYPFISYRQAIKALNHE